MLLRPLLATLAVASAAVAVAPAARAVDPTPTPEPNPGTALYGVTGFIGAGCSVPASLIQVRVQRIGSSIWRTVAASTARHGFTYTVTGLNRDWSYRLQPILESIPEACRYGRWSPGERTVAPPSSGSAVSGVNFMYQLPQHTTRIDGQAATTALNFALLDLYIHLNNYSSDDSYVRLQGERYPFSIPPKVRPLCRLRVCIGEARFYVNDVNLYSKVASWGGGIVLDLAFESQGREVSGEGSNAVIDPLVPDAELNDVRSDPPDTGVSARLQIRFVLVPDGRGGVTYALVGSPSFSTRLQLVNGCSDVLGFDLCPDVTDVADRVRTKVETRVATLLASSQAHEKVDPKLNDRLPDDVGTVDAVVTDSTGFVLIDY